MAMPVPIITYANECILPFINIIARINVDNSFYLTYYKIKASIKNMKLTCLLLTFFVILLIYGCKGNHSRIESDTTEEIEFNIDPSKLGNSILSPELEIKFSPPIEWNNVSEETFIQIKKSIKSVYNDRSEYTIEPKYLFTNDIKKSLLIVSLLRFKKNDSPFQEKIRIYKNVLEQNFNKNELKITEYLKDSIRIKQYLIQKQNQINFKLLFTKTDGDIIQFDYSSVKEFYPDEIRGIESSIGSIKLINFSKSNKQQLTME